MMRVSFFVLFLVVGVLFVHQVRANCECNEANTCSCSSRVLNSSTTATVNVILGQNGVLTFEQILGEIPFNTFAIQTPNGATCTSTETLSWCLIVVNFANYGHSASGVIVSTFVQKGMIYESPQGSFSVRTLSSQMSSLHKREPSMCGNCHNGCSCNPGKGCFCCNYSANACITLIGLPGFKFLQGTVSYLDRTWLTSTSQVGEPQQACTVNDKDPGTLCLSMANLAFGQGTTSGYVYLVYHNSSANAIALGQFKLV